MMIGGVIILFILYKLRILFNANYSNTKLQ